jgi:hypothetical protein
MYFYVTLVIELSPIYLETKSQHKTMYFYATPVIELSPIYLETKSQHKTIYFHVVHLRKII